jgi:hypothetical protein
MPVLQKGVSRNRLSLLFPWNDGMGYRVPSVALRGSFRTNPCIPASLWDRIAQPGGRRFSSRFTSVSRSGSSKVGADKRMR